MTSVAGECCDSVVVSQGCTRRPFQDGFWTVLSTQVYNCSTDRALCCVLRACCATLSILEGACNCGPPSALFGLAGAWSQLLQ